MNTVVVGCGNIGFETARLLRASHRVLVISRNCPPDSAELFGDGDGASFARADACDPAAIDRVLADFCTRFGAVDVLVSTIGASCPNSALDDLRAFENDFRLNFFGNLVPVKTVLNYLSTTGPGRIVVLSSTSGVFTYRGLTAYPPAKWALTALCRSLRDELRAREIAVDIVFPRTIRNQRSRTFRSGRGLEAAGVAREIVTLLERKGGIDRFIPRHYALLRPVEAYCPHLLDLKAGLRPTRAKHFRARQIDSVLITGACSPLAGELAATYARAVRRVILAGPEETRLMETRKRAMPSCKGTIDVLVCNLADPSSSADLAGRVGRVDILINNAGPGAEGLIRDLDMAAYEDAVGSVFLGFVRLIVELRRAQALPAKIINVLTADVLAGRSGRSCGAAGQAALWAFTRSLRRTCGNETQVVEAVLPAFAGTARAAESGRQWDGRSEADGARPNAVGIAAARIREAERHGRERIAISGNRVHSRSARETVTGFQMGCSDA